MRRAVERISRIRSRKRVLKGTVKAGDIVEVTVAVDEKLAFHVAERKAVRRRARVSLDSRGNAGVIPSRADGEGTLNCSSATANGARVPQIRRLAFSRNATAGVSPRRLRGSG